MDWTRWTELRDDLVRRGVEAERSLSKGEIDRLAFAGVGARIAQKELQAESHPCDVLIAILKADRPPFWIANQWFNEALRQFDVRAAAVAEYNGLRMARVAYVSAAMPAATHPHGSPESQAALDHGILEAARQWEFHSRLAGPEVAHFAFVEALHRAADRLTDLVALYRALRGSAPGVALPQDVLDSLASHEHALGGLQATASTLAARVREMPPAPGPGLLPALPEEEWAAQAEPAPASPPADGRTASERLKDLDF